MSGIAPRGPIIGDTPPGGDGGALFPGGLPGSGAISTGGSPLSLPAKPSTAPQQNVTSVSNPTDTQPQEGQPLWMRKWKLTIGPNTGGTNQAYDLSQFAFEFEITLQQFQYGNPGHVTVYNMDSSLLAKVNAKEITNLSLEAGYSKPSNQYGPVIRGQIVYYRAGRRNATDTFVEFFVAPWDQAINATVVNQWLPVGHKPDDVVNAVTAVMAPYGITRGQITYLGDTQSPRGRLLFGMGRDILRDVARTADAQWFIDQSGKLHMLKQDELLKMGSQSVPILNSKTGMVDVPILVPGAGIEVHSLLNPQIKPGEQVQVNEADLVQTVAVTQDNQYFADQLKMMKTARMTTDGHFNVLKVRHFGHNRGNPWYSHVTTVNAYGQGVPQRPVTSSGAT